jgi:hypothetical protein
MKLILTKLGNIAVIIITILLTLYPSYFLLLVRLGDYIVNLCDFYSYKIITRLTSFFPPSGVHLTQPTSAHFHFRPTVFSTHLRSKIVNILVETRHYGLI